MPGSLIGNHIPNEFRIAKSVRVCERIFVFNPKPERRNTMEQITLYYRQGSSDKVYQAGIVPQVGGHVVQFAYGRRG